ncbi:MAG: hypothetical protein RJA07_1181 [Bacteroidota bacterium]|jgi:hypothetical protein
MEQLDFEWGKLTEKLRTQFDKKPDVDALLFLIGIRELGSMPRVFTKEEKQDLMHIATCKLLSRQGFYELEFCDQQGWPHWKAIKPLPSLTMNEQETLLKENIIEYFNDLDYFK